MKLGLAANLGQFSLLVVVNALVGSMADDRGCSAGARQWKGVVLAIFRLAIMSYDEGTAARIRALLGKRRDVVERKMFGGLTFMVNGTMCCGVTSEALVVRVGPAEYERALAEPHARPMDFTGRPLVGMVYVDPPGYRTAPALARWIRRGLNFVIHARASTRPGARTAARPPVRPHSKRSAATKRTRRRRS